ncbi:MAG: hypothetical protein V1926_01670 [Candidatus Peregrinibacteria bacterium]
MADSFSLPPEFMSFQSSECSLLPGTRVACTPEVEQQMPRPTPHVDTGDPLADADINIVGSAPIYIEVVRVAAETVILREVGTDGAGQQHPEFSVSKDVAVSAAYEAITRLPDEALEEPDAQDEKPGSES